MSHIPPSCLEWRFFDVCYEDEIPLAVKDHFLRTPAFDAVIDGETWLLGEVLADIERTASELGMYELLNRKQAFIPHPFAVRNRLLRHASASELEAASRIILDVLARHSPLVAELRTAQSAFYQELADEHAAALDEQREALDQASPDLADEFDWPGVPLDVEAAVQRDIDALVSKVVRYGFRSPQELHGAIQCVSRVPIDDPSIAAMANSLHALAPALAKKGWQRSAYLAASAAPSAIHIDRSLKPIQIPKNHPFLLQVKRLSLLVANRLRCSEEAALAHLTSPFVTAASFPVIVNFEIDAEERVPSRIVLTIDPTLSPTEVERIYKAAREKVFPNRKVKDLSQFQIALLSHVYWDEYENPLLIPAADATSERSAQRRAEKRWLTSKMHEWNRRYAPFVKTQKGRNPFFKDVSSFRKAVLQAHTAFVRSKPVQPDYTHWYPREEDWTGKLNPSAWH